MATFDAIAYLSETIQAALQTGLNNLGLVASADVILSTPNELKNFAPHNPAVTIFLYHVGVCGEMRNSPASFSPGGGVKRPSLPLELRYLITPWAQGGNVDKSTFDSHRIIGAILQILYDHTLFRFNELHGSPAGDTWRADDTVELILESVPVESHYDIWDPTEIPYRLSLTYLARVVGIDPTPAKNAPPVAVASFPGASS